jgi:hypothetical protein
MVQKQSHGPIKEFFQTKNGPQTDICEILLYKPSLHSIPFQNQRKVRYHQSRTIQDMCPRLTHKRSTENRS